MTASNYGVSENLDRFRSLSPYRKNKKGNGVRASKRKAIIVPAHSTPSLSYCFIVNQYSQLVVIYYVTQSDLTIWTVKRGKAAAKDERKKLLAPIALAA